jgi:hypothetical protein
MNIPGRGRIIRIGIGMGIQPDNAEFMVMFAAVAATPAMDPNASE